MALSTKRVNGIKWKGLGNIKKNIDRVMVKVEGESLAGLIEAYRIVKKDAENLAPVDTKNLKSSSFLLWGGGKTAGVSGGDTSAKFRDLGRNRKPQKGVIRKRELDHKRAIQSIKSERARTKNPFAVVGFSARYAIFVHERLGNRHIKGQAKFLEHAVNMNKSKIKTIMKKHVKRGTK